MFSLINRIFRKRDTADMDNLKLPPNDIAFIEQANIDPSSLNKDEANNYMITETTHELDIIGAHSPISIDKQKN